MYMLRAYQSPCSGTHCALQWFQMPNLASRNQSGVVQATSDSHVGLNGPGAMWISEGDCASILGTAILDARAAAGAAARADFNRRRRVNRLANMPAIIEGTAAVGKPGRRRRP